MTEPREIHYARLKLNHKWRKHVHQQRMEATTPEMERQMREVLEEISGYRLDEFDKSQIVDWAFLLSEPNGMD